MLRIRSATIDDASLLRTLIRELADYEHELHEVLITEEDLVRDGFGAAPKFQAIIAELESQVVGYALFFEVYSTWRGPQLFLEDLFIRPQFRRRGFARQMLAFLAQVARNRNCHALRWEVLDWNQPAIDLYRSLGAEFLDGWRMMMLKDDPLERLAEKAK